MEGSKAVPRGSAHAASEPVPLLEAGGTVAQYGLHVYGTEATNASSQHAARLGEDLFRIQVITGWTMHSLPVNTRAIPPVLAQPSEGRMSLIRKLVRTPKRLLVKILSLRAPFVSEICHTKDISSLGAQLITERFWMPGFRVLVKSTSDVLWASARVVYCRHVAPKAFDASLGERFAVGLEFLKPADGLRINSLG